MADGRVVPSATGGGGVPIVLGSAVLAVGTVAPGAVLAMVALVVVVTAVLAVRAGEVLAVAGTGFVVVVLPDARFVAPIVVVVARLVVTVRHVFLPLVMTQTLVLLRFALVAASALGDAP